MNPKSSVKKITSRFGVWRYSSVELLAALILFIAMMPLVDDLPYGTAIESALLTLVLISAVLAVGGHIVCGHSDRAARFAVRPRTRKPELTRWIASSRKI